MQANEKDNKGRKIISILKFCVLVVILVLVPLYFVIFQRDLLDRFSSYEQVVHFLRDYRNESALVYLAAQILQVMISVLPGQVFQFAAGSLFGFIPGLLLSIVGFIIGGTLTYYLARFLGEDALTVILGKDRMSRFTDWFNSENAYVIAFIIYLIPGMPKDLVCYAAGVSRMKFTAFIIISIVGRLPGVCASLLLGHLYMEGEYKAIIIAVVIVAVILLICLIFRKRLHKFIDHIYEKIS